MASKITRMPFDKGGDAGNTFSFNFKNGKTVDVTLLPAEEMGVIFSSNGRRVKKKSILSDIQCLFQMSANLISVAVYDTNKMEVVTEEFTEYDHLCSAEELTDLFFRVSKS